MQLLRLKLENFRQHESTNLELGTELLAIVGPNGSGKSTLLEAIAWALYGTAAARGTKGSIKRRGAKARARVAVTLVFVIANNSYQIKRSLTSAELRLNGEVIANSTGSVTDRVSQLLGMSRDEFFNTYFTGQKELAVMASMTPAERARFLSRVLQYDRLRVAQDRLRDKRSNLRSELKGIEQGLANPQELAHELDTATTAMAAAVAERDESAVEVSRLRAKLEEISPSWTKIQEQQKAWQGLDGEQKVAEAKVLAARSALASIDKEMAAALDARNRCEPLTKQLAELAPLKLERESLDRTAAEVALRSKIVARRDAINTRLKEASAELEQLGDAGAVEVLRAERTAALAERNKAAEALELERTRWKQAEQEAKTRLQAFREQYKELREQRSAIQEAGPDGTCPFCARPLGSDFQTTVDLLSRQMEELEASGGYLSKRVEQLVGPPELLKELGNKSQSTDMKLRAATEALAAGESALTRRVALEREMRNLNDELNKLSEQLSVEVVAYDSSRHDEVRRRIGELEPMQSEHDKLIGLASRAEQLVADAATAEQHASAMELTVATLAERIERLNWDESEFNSIQSQFRELGEQIQAAELRRATAMSTAEGAQRLRESAVARKEDRAKKAARATELTADIERVSELDRSFGDLRTELNIRLRPELADRAGILLNELTGGRYSDLELSEDFVPTIVEHGEAKQVISGGEEDVVNLALRLAISQMIADRAGQPLSLLVLDEVFGSLDEERRESVVAVLRALSDRFPQVVLISHVDGLNDAVDRVVRVQYNPGTRVTTLHEEPQELVGAGA